VKVRSCEFGPLRVVFDDTVLEPRPWTVLQSRHAARLLEDLPPGPLLELHCGAGHIGQAAAVWSARPLVQIDDDPSACRWARDNAAINGVRATVECVGVHDFRTETPFALVLADRTFRRRRPANSRWTHPTRSTEDRTDSTASGTASRSRPAR
jgi:methylase of polypeptide subunit release factors